MRKTLKKITVTTLIVSSGVISPALFAATANGNAPGNGQDAGQMGQTMQGEGQKGDDMGKMHNGMMSNGQMPMMKMMGPMNEMMATCNQMMQAHMKKASGHKRSADEG